MRGFRHKVAEKQGHALKNAAFLNIAKTLHLALRYKDS